MVKRSDISDDEVIAAIRWARQVNQRGGCVTGEDALACDYPRKVIQAKMQHVVDRGLLDYGVSLRTAWVIGDPHV